MVGQRLRFLYLNAQHSKNSKINFLKMQDHTIHLKAFKERSNYDVLKYKKKSIISIITFYLLKR